MIIKKLQLLFLLVFIIQVSFVKGQEKEYVYRFKGSRVATIRVKTLYVGNPGGESWSPITAETGAQYQEKYEFRAGGISDVSRDREDFGNVPRGRYEVLEQEDDLVELN